jgi:hypothetical protein
MFDKLKCSKTMVLNLGYAYPQGYVGRLQGVRKISKSPQNRHIPLSYLYKMDIIGGTQSVSILFRGYAKKKNNDFRVREYKKVENSCSKS